MALRCWRRRSAHIVIDDGRRFLDRSAEKFDAVIIDPPPPVEAAGSSLLYSREFYVLVKEHLRPGGILQQWLYRATMLIALRSTRALMDVFPYVKVCRVDVWRARLFITWPAMQPIPDRSATELLARMPQSAITDMMEWGPARTPEDQFNLVLFHETSPEKLIARSPNFPALDDDRPDQRVLPAARHVSGEVEREAAGSGGSGEEVRGVAHCDYCLRIERPAVPTGLGSEFSSYPALRLPIRAKAARTGPRCVLG